MKRLTAYLKKRTWGVDETPVHIVSVDLKDDSVVDKTFERKGVYNFQEENFQFSRKSHKEHHFVDHHPTYTGFLDLKNSLTSEEKRCYIGYDIETQVSKTANGESKSKILSHQLYFAHNKKRLGIIIVSPIRFTERAFLEMLAAIVPEECDKAYLSAHFSLYEGGHLLRSKRPYKKWLDDGDEIARASVTSAEVEFFNLVVESMRIKHGKGRNFSGKNDNRGEISNLYKHFPADIVEAVGGTRNYRHGQYLLLEMMTEKIANQDINHSLVLMLSKKGFERLKRELWSNPVPMIQTFEKQWHKSCPMVTAETFTNLTNSIKEDFNVYQTTTESKQKELFDNLPTSVKELRKWYRPFQLIVFDLCIQRLQGNAVTKIWHSLAECATDGDLLINRRKCNYRDLDGVENTKKLLSRRFIFVDTLNYGAGSLANLGSAIGIDKLPLLNIDIANMEDGLKKHPAEFFSYGIRDAIVSGEATPYFAALMKEEGLPLMVRIAGYTASLFKNIFHEDIYGKIIPARQEIKVTDQNEIVPANVTYSKDDEGRATIVTDGGSARRINLKVYLGWEYAKRGKMKKESWWPTPEMASFSRFYYGGWNSCHEVGPRDSAYYYDLMSAYPCAILLLKNDYDFSRNIPFRDTRSATEAAHKMIDDGPFQIAGVTLSYKFRDDAEPMFPSKLSREKVPVLNVFEATENLIYPRQGYAHVSWPEFWTAMDMDLLESCQIFSLVTYPKLETNIFSSEVERLLKQRANPNMKTVMKSLLNYLYGKTSQAIRTKAVITGDTYAERRTLPGNLTCFPIAAYITSICRSVMGEFLNLENRCYAVTTDGFISPESSLEKGYIALKTDARLKSMTDDDGNSLNFQYVKTDFEATRSLFLKTRGYVLINDNVLEHPDVGPEPAANGSPESKIARLNWLSDIKKNYVKIARMGIKTQHAAPEIINGKVYDPEIAEFLEILNQTKYKKLSWPSFSKIKENGQNLAPIQRESESNLNHSYDMKRVLDIETLDDAEFVYQSESDVLKHKPAHHTTFKCSSFQTVPLLEEGDFILLRMHAMRNMDIDGYREFMGRFYTGGYGLNYINYNFDPTS